MTHKSGKRQPSGLAMVRQHVQILNIGDGVLIVAKAGEHKSHSPQMLEKVGAHVPLDVDQIVVHLCTNTTIFLYKKEKRTMFSEATM